MRLFIAINFDDEVKNWLMEVQSVLREQSDGGSFTSPENLHLTLAFLGETKPERLDALARIMDSAAVQPPFALQPRDVGRFGGRGGDTWWVGLEKSGPLLALYSRLSAVLSAEGFPAEAREYRPHLTIAREIHLLTGADSVVTTPPPPVIRADGMSLMLSQRVKGLLTYTELRYSALG